MTASSPVGDAVVADVVDTSSSVDFTVHLVLDSQGEHDALPKQLMLKKIINLSPPSFSLYKYSFHRCSRHWWRPFPSEYLHPNWWSLRILSSLQRSVAAQMFPDILSSQFFSLTLLYSPELQSGSLVSFSPLSAVCQTNNEIFVKTPVFYLYCLGLGRENDRIRSLQGIIEKPNVFLITS